MAGCVGCILSASTHHEQHQHTMSIKHSTKHTEEAHKAAEHHQQETQQLRVRLQEGATHLAQLEQLLHEREARLDALTASLEQLKIAQEGRVAGSAERAAAAQRRVVQLEQEHAAEVCMWVEVF